KDNTDLVPYFLALISDNYFEVRLAAVQFLGRFYSPQIVDALQQRLSDKDCDVRLAATKALGVLGDPIAIESLFLARVHKDAPVRAGGEASPTHLALSWLRSDGAPRAAAPFDSPINDRPPWVPPAASQVLSKLPAAATNAPVQNPQ